MARSQGTSTLAAGAVATLALAGLTGAALAFPYAADPLDAHASAAAAPAPLRAAHAWSASLAVALLALAGARAFVERASPTRGFPWLAPLVAGLALAAFESGAVLPWDQRAWEAWLHVRDGAALFGLRPGGDGAPADGPLAAVFAAHVAVAAALVALVLGLAVRARLRASRSVLAAGGVAVAGALLLAALAPPALGPAPVEGLAVSRPHWPFLWITPLESAFGRAGLLALPVALAFLAAAAWAGPKVSRRARVALVLSAAALLGGLTSIAAG